MKIIRNRFSKPFRLEVSIVAAALLTSLVVGLNPDSQLLLAGLAFPVVLFAAARPAWGCILYIALLHTLPKFNTLSILSFGSFDLRPDQFVLAAVVLGVLLRPSRIRTPLRRYEQLLVALLALQLLSFLSNAFIGEYSLRLFPGFFTRELVAWILFFVAGRALSDDESVLVIKGLVLLGLLTVVVALAFLWTRSKLLADLFFGESYVYYDVTLYGAHPRSFIPGAETTIKAAYLVLLVFLVASRSGWMRVMSAAGLVPIVARLLTTWGRSVMASYAFGTLISLVVVRRYFRRATEMLRVRWQRVLVLGIVVGIAVGLGYSFSPLRPSVSATVAKLTKYEAFDDPYTSVGVRTSATRVAIRRFISSPYAWFLGFGPRTQGQLQAGVYREGGGDIWPGVRLIYENGLPYWILYLYLNWLFVRQAHGLLCRDEKASLWLRSAAVVMISSFIVSLLSLFALKILGIAGFPGIRAVLWGIIAHRHCCLAARDSDPARVASRHSIDSRRCRSVIE